MATDPLKTVIKNSGHYVKIASDPLEADSADLYQCPNCGNGSVPRKAGAVTHCVSCGYVITRGNE
jgi:ribosomal protein L37AE/L43A